MDIKRLGLTFVLALIAVTLWQAWQKDYPPAAVKQAQQQQVQKSKDYTPPTFNQKAPVANQSVVKQGKQAQLGGRLVEVKTNVLDLKFSTAGGNLVSAKLLKYPVSVKKKDTPIELFNTNSNTYYVSQSGLTNTGSRSNKPIQYSNATVTRTDQAVNVTFKGRAVNGLTVTKTVSVPLDRYAIAVNYNVKNTTGKVWHGSIFTQLVRHKVESGSSFFAARAYTGAAISSSDKRYEKITFKDMNKNNLSRNILGGWVAMQQHYFLSAWVPNPNATYHYYSHVADDVYTIGMASPSMQLAKGKSDNYSAKLYVGPEIAKNLKPLANGLDLTIDYGWLWWLSTPIFKVMEFLHHYLGNWGWTIVIVTLLIKLLFYKLSDKSYRSMAKMREVQPRMAALKERYGGDKQALSKATMEFYRKEKVNPMGGCLPMLIQIPVFFALYYVLIESVQLRQAPFIFWIQDLSVRDPYYVLPVLMGLSMLLQQKISPPPPDPTQAKVMMLLPLVFTVLFATFPAGLVLYWFVNNMASVTQQWYVMKTYDPKKEAQKARQKAKNKKAGLLKRPS